MPYLAEQGAGGADGPPEVRRRAAMLGGVVGDFSATLGASFLGFPETPPDEVLAAYARDHLRAPPEGGG